MNFWLQIRSFVRSRVAGVSWNYALLRSQVVKTTRAVTMPTMITSPLVIESISVAIMDQMEHSRENVVVIGLGGNIEDVVSNFVRAKDKIGSFCPVHALSHLYRSTALGPRQPDFLNAAILVEYSGPLEALLCRLQEVERDLGRVRLERWGPRTLDLDILWAASNTSNTSTLTVPHAELRRRAFALLPLLDLNPVACDPDDQRRYRSILSSLPSQKVVRIRHECWPK